MRIHALTSQYKLGFTSLRTDKKEVEQLKTGNKPILENRRENILQALNNIAANPERKSIEFLLDVAKHIQYGQNGNSEFKKIIDETTEIHGERENTDWLKLLEETIEKALGSSSEEVSDLEQDFLGFFAQQQPLTPEQEEVLTLRKDIKKSLYTEKALADAESLDQTTRISQNIDFFVSSSEISMSQKKECLELIQFFMSDDYNIVPQLKDKKIQILDEMLTDIIVKTPADDILTTKGINQLFSGICAAISVCRKQMAYEDKTAYIKLVMEELKDSPTMSVYDITKLGSGEKVEIPKISIDYDSAIDQGYRIVDISAHNWMQNAHSSGNGSIQSETYTAFDSDTFGVFNDTSWYEGLNPEFSLEKTLLKCLIKEKEALESVQKTREQTRNASNQVQNAKKKAAQVQAAFYSQLNRILSSIFGNLSQPEIIRLQKSIINFVQETQSTNEINMPKQLPSEVKQKIIIDFIKSNVETTPEQDSALSEEAERIISLADKYVSEDKSIKKLQSFSTKAGKYTYYRKLFNLAASHRLAVEADVNLSDGVIRFERLSGLPPRDIQISDYLKSLKKPLERGIIPNNLTFNNNVADKTPEELKQEIISDIVRIESTLPNELDSIAIKLFGVNTEGIVKNLLTDLSKRIEDGDIYTLNKAAAVFHVKTDKKIVIDAINKKIAKIEKSPSEEELLESIRLLGFENRLQMMSAFMSSFINALKQGISEEQFNEYAKRFGGEDKVSETIEAQRQLFLKILNEYEEIEKKWNVPSSRELIIKELEKSNLILSRKELEILKKRFDYIRHFSQKNESIQNTKAKHKANRKLYEFSPEELHIFNLIEKAFPHIKKYCKSEYKALNNILHDELERQYSELGMLNGQFWVREEGATGLSANEQLRIIEQMTGEPYHIEYDVEKAADKIKKGNGSGVASYSVDDNDYGFHAMYAPSVTTETITNPITGQQEQKEILWTDNSWGRMEKEYFWNGRNGFNYTDYGQGLGWKNGFMISKDMKIGLPVQEMKNAIGHSAKHNEKFGLFLEVLLPGRPANAYQKLYKMFNNILTIKDTEVILNALEESLKDGYKISPDFLNGLDDLAEIRTTRLKKRIEKEIKTKEDFDKLPDDDYLKIILTMLSLYMSTSNPNLADAFLSCTTMKELEEAKEELIQEQAEEMGAIVAKSDASIDDLAKKLSKDILAILAELKKQYDISFTENEEDDIVASIFYNEKDIKEIDGSLSSLENYFINQIIKVAENKFTQQQAAEEFIRRVTELVTKEIDNSVRIKSLKSPALDTSPLYDEFIAAIDKYLKPKSDEDLLTYIQGLQLGNYDDANQFFELLQPEDLGINIKHPFEYIQRLNAEDASVEKALSEVIGTNVITEELKSVYGDKEDDDDDSIENAKPEDLYRTLYIKLVEMDVQKYIRNYKAEAFAKYKVRQAFPQPIILPDESIAKNAIGVIDTIEEHVQYINTNKYMIDIFDSYNKILSEYKSEPIIQAILNLNDFHISSGEDIDGVNAFKSNLISLYNLIAEDRTLDEVKEPLKTLIQELSKKTDTIDGEIAGKALMSLISVFDTWEKSGITKDKFVQLNNEELATIRKNLCVIVNANIDPAYRNKALNQLKNIIDLIRKNKDQSIIDKAKDDYIEFAVDKHIVKNPTALLKEFVRYIQEGKSGSEEFGILKDYLTESLRVAQQTKVQYKLVQNAHVGISSKTKDLLSLFDVYLSNGQRESMDSESGMLYIINQLTNKGEDYTTLQLFLNQTGLSELALTAILNNFNLDESKNIVDEKYNKAIKAMEELNQINGIISEFFEKNRIKFASFDMALKNLITFVKRKTKNDNNETVQSYITYIESLTISDELKALSTDMLMPVLKSVNEDIIRYLTQQINSDIDYIADVGDLLNEKAELINAINVPQNSEVQAKKTDFLKHFDEIHEYINSKLQEITSTIEEYEFLSAEYKY